MKLAVLMVLVCLCASNRAVAVQLVGSDHHLQFLKKMQGSWQRDCRKVVSAGKALYEQTQLIVSFTQLTFKTVEYSNKECSYVFSKYTTQYSYTLGEIAQPIKGKNIYQLDVGQGPSPGIIRLYPKNIIQFDDGYLYFGLRTIASAENNTSVPERLTLLDRQAPFYRR